MLTDDEARDLLHSAADTIDVGPAEPLPSAPPRPRWPLLAAAAVGVAMIAALLLVLDDENADPEPAEKVGTVPSVFAHDRSSAVAMLEGLGLDVTVVPVPSCGETPGRATATRPSAGTTYHRGDRIRLLVTSAADGYCAHRIHPDRELAWQLIDLATGRGDGPTFAPHVDLWVNGARTASLSARQAADPASWGPGSALAAIAEDAAQVNEINGHYVTPTLTTRTERGSQFACGDYLPRVLSSRDSLVFWMRLPVRHANLVCSFVNLFVDERGRVETVVLRTTSPIDDAEPLPSEPTASQRAVADAFVAWARDETAQVPPFAEEVQLLAEDLPLPPLTNAEAGNRDLWSLCSGLPPDECRANALRVLDEYDGPVVQSRTLAVACVPDPRRLPDPLMDAVDDELIRLDRPEPKNCRDAFAVELWITGEGLIRAVNLLP